MPLLYFSRRDSLGCDRFKTYLLVLLAALGLAVCPQFVQAQDALRVASPFGSGMVLQQNLPLKIWGTAESGQYVTVKLVGLKRWGDPGEVAPSNAPFTERKQGVTVDELGQWSVTLNPVTEPGHYELYISSGQQQITLENVLVGEVWFCSGQSNMQWSVKDCANPQEEISNANWPGIRLMQGPRVAANEPTGEINAKWTNCTPQTIANFSACAYYFGRHLHQQLGVPIGLIHSSWGGTPAEAWTSWASLEQNPDTQIWIKQTLKTRQAHASGVTAHRNTDPGLTLDDIAELGTIQVKNASWPTLKLPNRIETIKANLDGVLWFHRQVDLPESLRGKNLTLLLGRIDDNDVTFVNGQEIGRTNGWSIERSYEVPASLTQQEQIQITVRLYDGRGPGGFVSTSDKLRLFDPQNPSYFVNLSGQWHYHVQYPMSSPNVLRRSHEASVLYNAMVVPYAGYGIKGAIWYQGESNERRAKQYHTLLSTMIKDWRQAWNQPNDFAFGIVQLASFRDTTTQPVHSKWADIRQAQAQTAQTVPNAGIATAIDLGNAKDIHPKNKQEVGRRLALWALATQYDQDIVFKGPEVTDIQFQGPKVTLTIHANDPTGFQNHVSQIPTEQNFTGFSIADETGHWHWASAKLIRQEKDTLVLLIEHPKAQKIKQVRYAWADNAQDGPNALSIFNASKLPMLPWEHSATSPSMNMN